MTTVHALSNADAEAYLDLGATARDVVRLAWPDATDRQADYILWELTPFPMVSGIHDIADSVAIALDENGSGLLDTLPTEEPSQTPSPGSAA